ncbi:MULTISPECIES: type II secretion system protein [unclassified Janthinobacterium]|uniref:type II secretion system protein n=1 Tax=unclassified Janthinobacterium TaxID=2610881 RepID=UPI00161BAF9C|nr:MULTISPECIES: type II secretion system protein [unclassified Janthinobacterium]MBB5368336.1 type II secretory pathway pseudopilin PulG [Janthinobacterium sp. K2C7]MBB5382128.1 type II secretory pathway pseudopilin PulG [Janthinobacterium sp. K2Li3]MBB5386718.1 type II secretory pathway pseudopilin PulG [Janthinobacterium sp. K2E3]
MRRGDVFAAQRGFTYVAMLFALAMFGIGLAAVGVSWSAATQREREEELIQIGQAYVRAIGDYYAQAPGSVKTYPPTLQDLVEDRRFVGVRRHLRKVYLDPVGKGAQWGLVKAADGGIAGVYSLNEGVPLRRQPLLLPGAAPVMGARYADWKFVYVAAP